MARSKTSEGDIVHQLATDRNIKMVPGQEDTFTIALPDMQLCAEITIKFRHQAPKDDIKIWEEGALEQIANIDSGSWADQCSCSVADRSRWSSSKTKGCDKAVVGVIVTRGERWNTQTNRTEPMISYVFRCHIHMDKPTRDDSKVVYRTKMKSRIEAARAKRIAAKQEREHWNAMCEEERIIRDAFAAGRDREADAMLGDLRAKLPWHSTLCARLAFKEVSDFAPYGKDGNPNAPCTCDFPQRRAQLRALRNNRPDAGLSAWLKRELERLSKVEIK